MKSIATVMAMLALGAAPAALAQPDATGQSNPSARPYPGYQGYPGPSQGQWDPNQNYRAYPPSDQPPSAEQPNERDAQQYDRSEDAYEQQLRQYQHDRRVYERQRDAYDAQSDAKDANANAPPPPSDASSEHGFYRYSETLPFRDGPWERGDRDGRWFREHGCRLAAPHDDPDPDPGHVFPVCPDADGHYRPAE